MSITADMAFKPVRAPKNARIEVRATAEQKLRFEYAASLSGVGLTEFIRAKLDEVAIQTIARHERMRLTGVDRDAFVAALLDPPEPNEALKAAAEEYKDLTR